LVDEADAEEAAALLHDLRTREVAGEDEPDEEDDQDDLTDPERLIDDELAAASSAALSIEARVDRRRRTGIALLLACCVTFGTGHMFSRAWLRGVMLAGLEVFAFTRLGVAPLQGALLCAAAVVTDAVGSVMRVRRGGRPTVPRAQL